MDGVLAPKSETASGSDVLSGLSREELAAWRLSDQLPDRVTAPVVVAEPPAAEPAPLAETPVDEATTQEAESAQPDAAVSDAARALRRNRLDERRNRIRSENELYEDTIRQLGGWPDPPKAKAFDTPQAEIDALTRRRHDLLEHTNRLLRQGVRPSTQVQQAAPPSVQVSPAPNEAVFPTFDAWLQAYPDKDWSEYVAAAVDHRTAAILAARETLQQRQTLAQMSRTRIETFKVDHPDWDAVTSNPAVVATPALLEALTESEVGPQIAYFLGQHPEESRRLAGLAPASFLKAFGRLEAHLTSPAAVVPPPPLPAASLTTAPPPPPTLGTRPAQPVDPSRAALDRGDFRAFQAAENAKAVARAKASGRL